MAPASRPGTSTSKPLKRQSKPQDIQTQLGSPSSKSHTSSRTSGGGRSHRPRRSSNTAKSSLRETLSSFGDDVIKVKNYPSPYAYENHGYFQPDIPLDTGILNDIGDESSSVGAPSVGADILEKGGGESELAIIMSHHDPNFQTKSFEKVNPSEVGVRSSKWKKLFQSSVTSRSFQNLRKQSRGKLDSEDDSSGNFAWDEFCDGESGRMEFNPPFWGVSKRTRSKISFLSLSLILHEWACFTSCVLLGCMMFQGMETISWAQQKPFTDNGAFFKWYSSLQTLLVVITCLGFLNRVDTTEFRKLWVLPFFLIPVLGLSISDYCNKVWELQRIECLNYLQLDKLAQGKVHLSQDCSPLFTAISSLPNTDVIKPPSPSTSNLEHVKITSVLTTVSYVSELDARGIAPIVMRVLATLSTLVISLYLFWCRKSYFLIDLFGPPKELHENLEYLLSAGSGHDGTQKKSRHTSIGVDRMNQEDGDIRIIYKRNE